MSTFTLAKISEEQNFYFLEVLLSILHRLQIIRHEVTLFLTSAEEL